MPTAQDLATTQRFIDYRPSDITIRRSAVTATAAGGKKREAPADVGVATVRVVEMGQIGNRVQRLTAGGDLAVPSHLVTCMPDIDAERHDEFDWDGSTWEVLWVSHLPDWRTQLEVIKRG